MMIKGHCRYGWKECNPVLRFMLKSLSVSSSLLCFASVSLASTAVVTAPYLMADSRFNQARSTENPKSAQCRALFENVVDARRVGAGFYSRKASNIRSLRLSDGKLQSLQARFGQVFTNLDQAQRSSDQAATNKFGRQASQLVGELNRHCFQ
jgi:hypothetical protein